MSRKSIKYGKNAWKKAGANRKISPKEKVALYHYFNTTLFNIFKREVTNVIDEEIIKSIKDPSYKPELIPFN
jgi:hypothetical protein